MPATAEMLRDDEDWDPTRVIAGKRRKIQRKADRKRRKIKTERELTSRQADPRRLAQHLRTVNQARDTNKAKRAQASEQERISRQQNPQRLAQHIRTVNQARARRVKARARRVKAEHKVGVGSKIYLINLLLNSNLFIANIPYTLSIFFKYSLYCT